MKFLWSKIDCLGKSELAKYRLSRIAAALFAAVCGAAVGFLLQLMGVIGTAGMICLIGYPAVIAWTAAYIYGCNHPFHQGAYLAKPVSAGEVRTGEKITGKSTVHPAF